MRATFTCLVLFSAFILFSGMSFRGNNAESTGWIKNIIEKLDVYDYYMSMTSDGNLVVAGSFSNKSKFGNKMLVAAGSNDIFIAQYAPDGSLMWVRQAGGSEFDMANMVRTDTLGNIYITGYVTGISFFGDYILRSKGLRNVFTAKYDKKGEIVWMKAEGADLYYETDPKKKSKIMARLAN